MHAAPRRRYRIETPPQSQGETHPQLPHGQLERGRGAGLRRKVGARRAGIVRRIGKTLSRSPWVQAGGRRFDSVGSARGPAL